MTRVYNFSAGPATLPEPVLRQAAEEMLDWQGTGMSVMETSHRSPPYLALMEDTLARLRRLLAVPAGYEILFMQGGALAQNALVPMNLLGDKTSIDFVDTGEWSRKSIAEAARYARVNVVASSATTGYDHVPPPDGWRTEADAAYLHICSNETIGGVEYGFTPNTGTVPLVADMSSCILSQPIDVARYGLIYAGAQKNIGPAGLTIVIVRRDLLDRALPVTPTALTFKTVAANGSMYNTPPTYAIYIASLVFKWIEAQGGLPAMAERNAAKASLLYETLDRSVLERSGLFRSRVRRDSRSRMNVTFHLRDEALTAPFLAGAHARGLVQLKGHRVVGGVRASIYNAMPIEGVQALAAWMAEFETQHG